MRSRSLRIKCYGSQMASDQPSRHVREEAHRRAALDELKELRGGESFAGSALVRAARRATDHFAGKDAVGPDGMADPIELWGRRIGRGLSLVAFVALAIY